MKKKNTTLLGTERKDLTKEMSQLKKLEMFLSAENENQKKTSFMNMTKKETRSTDGPMHLEKKDLIGHFEFVFRQLKLIITSLFLLSQSLIYLIK